MGKLTRSTKTWNEQRLKAMNELNTAVIKRIKMARRGDPHMFECVKIFVSSHEVGQIVSLFVSNPTCSHRCGVWNLYSFTCLCAAASI